LLSLRHCRRWLFRSFGHHASIFLEPFAPPELPGFVATMAPLTPARRFFASHAGKIDRRLVPDRSLCVMRSAFRPFRLQPPGVPRRRFVTLPLSATSFHTWSGLRLYLAGSPRRPAESSSLALRTGRSLPDTLHATSRQRSFVQLQAGERILEKDLHLSDISHLQTYKVVCVSKPDEDREVRSTVLG
jgi:hypothetical protein